MTDFPSISHLLPPVRGSLRENVALAPYSWLRVGGVAQALFMPKDEADLSQFLARTPQEVRVHILGVASNSLIRDGGIAGVVIRLGPNFAQMKHNARTGTIRVGAGALDAMVAKFAAKSGLSGLEFFAGIPGTIGGALRMNAGCYESETKDILMECVALDRHGRRHILPVQDMKYTYRHCGAEADMMFIEAVFAGKNDEPEAIQARMDSITKRRESSQPIREKTGGSTFKNPDKKQSDGRGAWQVIDAVGGRGLMVGGAQMSEQHCNFMINTGAASAQDLEDLGETIRTMAKEDQGVDLFWEIRRVGMSLEQRAKYDKSRAEARAIKAAQEKLAGKEAVEAKI